MKLNVMVFLMLILLCSTAKTQSTNNYINYMSTRIYQNYTINRISGYTLHPRETDSQPYITSCGDVRPLLRRGLKIFAVSRDLFFTRTGVKHLCGKRAVLIRQNGRREYGVIYDTMARRFRNTVDVLIHSYSLSNYQLRQVAFRQYGVTRTQSRLLVYK